MPSSNIIMKPCYDHCIGPQYIGLNTVTKVNLLRSTSGEIKLRLIIRSKHTIDITLPSSNTSYEWHSHLDDLIQQNKNQYVIMSHPSLHVLSVYIVCKCEFLRFMGWSKGIMDIDSDCNDTKSEDLCDMNESDKD